MIKIVRLSLTLVYLYSACVSCDSLEEESCHEALRSMRQSIRLIDSGDGFTEMVPPQSELIHIWPNERATLFYQSNRPTKKNKVWVYKPPEAEHGYRLSKSISCIEQGVRLIQDPYEETYWINTSQSGSYMFAEFDTNWKLGKSAGTHYGRKELYNPLISFMVLPLVPASVGLTLKMSHYEPSVNCTGANARFDWIIQSLPALRAFRSLREDKAMFDGELKSVVMESKCHTLLKDESPSEVFAYYNIDRARITPQGVQPDKERAWTIKDKLSVETQFHDSKEIQLPDPFGAGVRIRLKHVQVPLSAGLQITLMTRSEEAQSEAFWGPGNVEPPFPEEQIAPYPFAVVDLNPDIFHQLIADGRPVVDWILIEPYYGRLRTSTGLTVPCNVKDRRSNGRYLTALKLKVLGNQAEPVSIREIIYERPQHPVDIEEVLRVLHTELPLPEATPLHGRACLSKAPGFYTSSYHVNLEEPKRCIQMDEMYYRVRKKTGSPRSRLTSYSIPFLYDDFGDELVNATGIVTGHIQMVSFPRKAQTRGKEYFCPMRTIGDDGEVMRIGFIDGRNKDVQFVARWENRWVHYQPSTRTVVHLELEGQDRAAEAVPGYCGPERSMIDIVYNLGTKQLSLVANDTRHTLVNLTLSRHPMWMGLEMFTDYKVPRCQGCYVNVFIDRRGIRLPYETEWPAIDSSINDWNQIQYPRQRDSKALYTRIVSISQNFEVRSALFPSAKNLGRRLVELTRHLANTMNVSVTVLESDAFCKEGEYMPYGTPAVCVKCPPGTRSTVLIENTTFPVHVCELCPQGTYQDQPGQSKCKNCEPQQSTPKRGSWSRGSCGPNVTTDGIFVAQSGGMPALGKPYVMVELPSGSKEQTYDWTKNVEDKEFQTIEGPGELNMVSTGRLVFNMISLVLLLGCVMAFVVTSKGYMLVWITQHSRHRSVATGGVKKDHGRASSKKMLWPRRETSTENIHQRSFSIR